MKETSGPIFLVGFMGAGKTTTGKALARLLGWDFLDLDELIMDAERMSIPEIFKERGEAYFRRVERRILASLRGRHLRPGRRTGAHRRHRPGGLAAGAPAPGSGALRRRAGASPPEGRRPGRGSVQDAPSR